MNLVSQYLFRVRRFFIAVLSVTVGSVLVLPMVSRAWTPTTPQISVAIFGDTGYDTGRSVTVDSSGNVYATGNFAGTVDFDPGVGIQNFISAGGSTDVFVSKLNSSGEYVWAKKFGDVSNDLGISVAVDFFGNVYTTGRFEGTVDFDPHATDTYNLISASGADVFVSKLNSSGGFVWAKKFGGSGSDYANSVAVDSFGNVYTTGRFEGTVDFDPHATDTYNLISASGADVFVSKLNSSGGFVWAKKFGGTSYNEGNSVAVDSFGNVYTTGYFTATVDFDPHATDTYNLISAGSSDVFVSKLDSFGRFVWAKRFGANPGIHLGGSVAVDSSDNVYTTGRFEGTVDFDPHATDTYNLISASGADVFVSKLNSSGGFVWAKRFGGSGSDIGNSVAVDSSDNVYTTGYFAGTADFDPHDSTAQNLISVASSYDVFVSKLNPAGEFLWAKKLGGVGLDVGQSVAVDSLGNVYTTGYFEGTADFDPHDTNTQNLLSAGSVDVFVVRLNPSGDSLASAAATTSTTTTTVPATTTTTVPVTTATVPATTTTTFAATTTTTTTTTTTVPASTALVLRAKKSVTAKAIATYAKLKIKPKSVVLLKIATASSKFCKVTGVTLKGLKAGSCKITVTVKPAKGKSFSKTVTLKVSK